MRHPALPSLVLIAAVSGCTTFTPPEIRFDDIPPLTLPPAPAEPDDIPKPLRKPPAWTPAKGGPSEAKAPKDPIARIDLANTAARVEPQRGGYFNAVQVYAYSPGALYQLYAAPGRISEIRLEPGESLVGPGPIAAGDTVRWIIADTVSGTGTAERVHVLVKPTRSDIVTNLVLNTDRRSYYLELRATDDTYMPAVEWAYPDADRRHAKRPPATPRLPEASERRYRYALSGDTPPWRPLSVYDDRRKVYVVFPTGIGQGAMPPLFVLGPDGKPELVNYRVFGNVMIVDRLFAAAELRLGEKSQEIVRIVRTDGRPRS